MADDPTTWVIGASGLLGRHVVERCAARGISVHTVRVPWSDDAACLDSLAEGFAELLDRSGDSGWSIVWAAGAGVVGTTQDVLDREQETFARFLDDLARTLTPEQARRGAVFVASSAGGVYAGSDHPPFSERTEPRPLAPYGFAKLQMEARTKEFAERTGVRCLVGRISNLYGPGQDLGKPQGLISQIGRTYLTRQPISLYVSLDTMRDYLYVTDCAEMIIAGLERLHEDPSGEPYLIKILAAQRSTTIAAVLGEYRRIFKRRPQVVLGMSPNSRFQVRDLRLRSTVLSDLDRSARTPLAVGIAATIGDIAQRMRESRLAGEAPTTLL